jgi:phosphohistidine swiveling domain-containing protein
LNLLDSTDDLRLVAVIRDAGATFLGPVQADLVGLVCLSGNLGSHLAIVSRELGTPALIGFELAEGRELVDGLQVELDPASGELRTLEA